MYILTSLIGGAVLGTFAFYYSQLVNWIFSSNDNSFPEDISYNKHPMSDSDSEDDSDFELESEEEEDDSYSDEDEDEDEFVKFNYNNEVSTKNTPCYMKDFYEETTLPPDWIIKSDKEKKDILDKELEVYMNQEKKN